MLTKQKILDVVGKVWWENDNILMDFLRNHLTPAAAAIYTLEHCAFAARFPQYFGNVIGNCPELGVRRYMIQNMAVEEVNDPTIDDGHYESLVKFGIALGLTREEIINYEPSLTMQMALNYWDNISRTRPWIEGFAGIGGLELNGHMETAKRYGQIPVQCVESWAPLNLPDSAMTHWVAAEAADPHETGHGGATITILCKYAKTEEQERAVLATLGQSLGIFRYQYDRIGEAAIAASKKQ